MPNLRKASAMGQTKYDEISGAERPAGGAAGSARRGVFVGDVRVFMLEAGRSV
ncbi:hypothetical protein J2S43_003559 [Catenuloplanes nepalensis]|uniref:Uncharacterized protein n=1 Tax=Catenuloplanes nepalensis TaxID=587533 RepID=A0ABT9MUC4_9ACTN|nr:hypothetical protein [Catenuloplanes nepalensis]